MRNLVFGVFVAFISLGVYAGPAEELTDILADKNIEITSILFNGTEQPIEECSKDDIIFLRADGTYIYTANTPCYDVDDENEVGTWKVYTKGERLLLETVTAEEVTILNVKSFNKKELITEEVFESEGETFTIKMIIQIK